VINLKPGAIEKVGVIGASRIAPTMKQVFDPKEVEGVWFALAIFKPASNPKDNLDCEYVVKEEAAMIIPSIIALSFIVFSFMRL